jgi:hypothetical protein
MDSMPERNFVEDKSRLDLTEAIRQNILNVYM